MEWFEYIIIVVAVSLVLLPIVLRIINKKRAIRTDLINLYTK